MSQKRAMEQENELLRRTTDELQTQLMALRERVGSADDENARLNENISALRLRQDADLQSAQFRPCSRILGPPPTTSG